MQEAIQSEHLPESVLMTRIWQVTGQVLLDTPDCPVELSRAVHILMDQEPPAVSETNERQSSTQQALHQFSMAAADQQMHQHQPAQWDQHAEAQRIQRDSNEMMTILLRK